MVNRTRVDGRRWQRETSSARVGPRPPRCRRGRARWPVSPRRIGGRRTRGARPLGCGPDRGESTVSLAELLTGSRPAIDGRSDIGLTRYVDEILASGFPGIRGLPERARNAQLDSYLTRIVDRDLPENGLNVRRPAAVHAWLAAYAAASPRTRRTRRSSMRRPPEPSTNRRVRLPTTIASMSGGSSCSIRLRPGCRCSTRSSG